MDVALVRGPAISPRGSLNNEPCPPIGLAYLAGSLRAAGLRVHGVDAAGEALDRVVDVPGTRLSANGLSIEEVVARVPRSARVIAVTTMFSHEWTQDRRLIKALRRAFPSAALVAGGEHATAMPEYVLDDCPELDVVGLGEGEELLTDLCARVAEGKPLDGVPGLVLRRDGKPVRTAPRERVRRIDAIPWPDWEFFPLEEYFRRAMSFGAGFGRNMPIMATRGCPYQCTFCSSPTMWTTRYVMRSADDVIREIEHYRARFGISGVQFYDLTAIIKKDWILEFCGKLRARGLELAWSLPSGTRSEAIDEQVVDALSAAGCRYLVYAPESGAETTLRLIKKKIKLDRLVASVKAAVARGISVRANLILGFPSETRADMFRTLWLQLRFAWMGVEDCILAPFQPYPGSELFRELVASGRIAPGDEYFETLATLSTGRLSPPDGSYCEGVGRRELHFYRVAGFLLFYVLSYLLRPARILRTVFRLLFTETSNTVFEQRLKDKWRKVRRGALARS